MVEAKINVSESYCVPIIYPNNANVSLIDPSDGDTGLRNAEVYLNRDAFTANN
jgi:hypothetical protein